jgi:hypothetical protein
MQAEEGTNVQPESINIMATGAHSGLAMGFIKVI